MTDTILKGIRVLDFGTYLAGAATTMHLARLGAEVIKIEHPTRPDGGRFFSTSPGVKPPDPRVGSQLFDTGNVGKLGMSIDLSKPEGKEVLTELIKQADVFYENMVPGSMAKHGFDYEHVREIKPDIIYVSSSSCGQEGPFRNFVGYAATFANMSGLGALTGYEGSRPSIFVGSIDMRSANIGLVAILAAIYHHEITGEGQFVDIASVEAIASHLGDAYLDYTVNGHEQGRMANKRSGFAPQDAYPALGDDRWIAISVQTEDQWRNLCEAMGQPELADDARFSSYEARVENAAALDAIISAWTSGIDRDEIVKQLQERNVPSSPSLNGEGVWTNEHCRARGVHVPIEHRELGTDYTMCPPWRFSETPASFSHPAPMLGEHTTMLLKDLLHMTDAQLDELAEKRAIRRVFDYDNPF